MKQGYKINKDNDTILMDVTRNFHDVFAKSKRDLDRWKRDRNTLKNAPEPINIFLVIPAPLSKISHKGKI